MLENFKFVHSKVTEMNGVFSGIRYDDENAIYEVLLWLHVRSYRHSMLFSNADDANSASYKQCYCTCTNTIREKSITRAHFSVMHAMSNQRILLLSAQRSPECTYVCIRLHIVFVWSFLSWSFRLTERIISLAFAQGSNKQLWWCVHSRASVVVATSHRIAST